MSINILGLRTVIYKVTDIAAAKDWYSKTFKTTPYFDEAFYVGYNIGGYELGLQPDSESGIAKAETVVAYWGVDDVEEAFQWFIEMGASENEAPQNVGGDIVVATVKDPWDNVVGLICNPGFQIESKA